MDLMLLLRSKSKTHISIFDALKQISRLMHGRSKKFVEKEIFARLDV